MDYHQLKITRKVWGKIKVIREKKAHSATLIQSTVRRWIAIRNRKREMVLRAGQMKREKRRLKKTTRIARRRRCRELKAACFTKWRSIAHESAVSTLRGCFNKWRSNATESRENRGLRYIEGVIVAFQLTKKSIGVCISSLRSLVLANLKVGCANTGCKKKTVRCDDNTDGTCDNCGTVVYCGKKCRQSDAQKHDKVCTTYTEMDVKQRVDVFLDCISLLQKILEMPVIVYTNQGFVGRYDKISSYIYHALSIQFNTYLSSDLGWVLMHVKQIRRVSQFLRENPTPPRLGSTIQIENPVCIPMCNVVKICKRMGVHTNTIVPDVRKHMGDDVLTIDIEIKHSL